MATTPKPGARTKAGSASGQPGATATKGAPVDMTQSSSPATVSPDPVPVEEQPSNTPMSRDDLVRQAAYARFLKRSEHGHDGDETGDWLGAEDEIARSVRKESGAEE